MLRLLRSSTIFLAPVYLVSAAHAIDVIGNFPSNDQVASDLDVTFGKAMGFTMPSGLPYTLDSAILSLFVDDLGAQTAWSFDLFADSNGDPDLSAPLVNLTLPALALGDDNYTLTPASPLTLQPNTTYWLVGTSASTSSHGGWNRNDPSKTPTGLAVSAGARSGAPPVDPSSFFNSYSIQATPVPGPLPILGLYAAFGASRTVRRRLHQHAM